MAAALGMQGKKVAEWRRIADCGKQDTAAGKKDRPRRSASWNRAIVASSPPHRYNVFVVYSAQQKIIALSNVNPGIWCLAPGFAAW